jgi:hypothetical protein
MRVGAYAPAEEQIGEITLQLPPTKDGVTEFRAAVLSLHLVTSHGGTGRNRTNDAWALRGHHCTGGTRGRVARERKDKWEPKQFKNSPRFRR